MPTTKKNYIVGAENSFCITGVEYFDVKGDTVYGYHDPLKVRSFTLKNDAKQRIASRIARETKLYELDKEIKKFKDKDFLYRKLAAISEKLNKPYDEKTMSKYDVLKWWMDYHKGEEESVSYEMYKTYPELYVLFQNLWDVKQYRDKIKEEYIYSVELVVKKDSEYQTFLEELNLVWDFVDRKDDSGRKIFSLMEHTLAEFGIYEIAISEDHKNCSILKTTYGDTEEVFSNHSLEAVFGVVRSEHYYK